MPRVSHPDPNRVLACPGCDHAGDIYRRTGNGNAYAGDPAAQFRCQHCGTTFETPVERESRHDPAMASQAARRKAAEDLISKLEGTQLVADGGEWS